MKHLSKVYFVAVLLTLLVTVGLSVHAQSDAKPEPQPETEFVAPLDLAREAGLGAEIGETQTVDDLSVTLDYAYADAHGVTLELVIESTRGQVEFSQLWNTNLVAQNGSTFTSASQSIRIQDSTPGITPLIHEYHFGLSPDDPSLVLPPDDITLTFTLWINGDPVAAAVDPERTAEAAVVSPESTREAVSEYAFEFDFTVPFYPALDQQVNDTQTANGTDITLKTVSISPVSTILNVCIELPAMNLWDLRAAQLEIDTQTVEAASRFFPGEECMSYEVAIYAGRAPQQLAFQVGALGESLMGNVSIDWEAIRPELEAQGVKVHLNADGTLNGLGIKSGGPDISEVNDLINELGYGERIDGPWTFEVDLQ